MIKLVENSLEHNICENSDFILNKLISKLSLLLTFSNYTQMVYETLNLLINLTAFEKINFTFEGFTNIMESNFFENVLAV